MAREITHLDSIVIDSGEVVFKGRESGTDLVCGLSVQASLLTVSGGMNARPETFNPWPNYTEPPGTPPIGDVPTVTNQRWQIQFAYYCSGRYRMVIGDDSQNTFSVTISVLEKGSSNSLRREAYEFRGGNGDAVPYFVLYPETNITNHNGVPCAPTDPPDKYLDKPVTTYKSIQIIRTLATSQLVASGVGPKLANSVCKVVSVHRINKDGSEDLIEGPGRVADVVSHAWSLTLDASAFIQRKGANGTYTIILAFAEPAPGGVLTGTTAPGF